MGGGPARRDRYIDDRGGRALERPLAAQPPQLDTILERATRCVGEFGHRFSMSGSRACSSVLLVACLVSGSALAGAQTVAVGTVMTRAGRYVNAFIDRFTNVVSEERYIQ